MKIAPFLLATALLLTTMAQGAHADSLVLFDGAQFEFSGSWIVTAGTHIGQTGTLLGSFTLGSMVTATTWNVTALSAGGIDSPLVPLTLSPGFVFNASNDTLAGTATSPTFLGSGGDTRQVIATFQNGNTTTNPFINNDLTDPTNSRSGTFGYSITAVPEPASLLLLGFGLGGLAALRRLRNA